ncbi:MAG: hypothetical protein E7293_02060 [Lachnospiraceae bacterium]|nr:hypothetical protein [Lachnospiraceae bacterium]
MRYVFEGKIEQKEEGYVISLPFNVWEVCKKREVIQAEMILDNELIDCELHPIEKGNYELFIKKEHELTVDLDVKHKIMLRIPESLIKMDQNSPYSAENPIRQIDSIEVIIQPADGLCGQACVAMLAGVSIEEVANVMGCREWQATMGHVISALKYYGIGHDNLIIFTEGQPTVLPKCCILMEKMGRFCHYLVYYNGKYYDSNLGILEEYDMSKLQGYLEIFC